MGSVITNSSWDENSKKNILLLRWTMCLPAKHVRNSRFLWSLGKDPQELAGGYMGICYSIFSTLCMFKFFHKKKKFWKITSDNFLKECWQYSDWICPPSPILLLLSQKVPSLINSLRKWWFLCECIRSYVIYLIIEQGNKLFRQSSDWKLCSNLCWWIKAISLLSS